MTPKSCFETESHFRKDTGLACASVQRSNDGALLRFCYGTSWIPLPLLAPRTLACRLITMSFIPYQIDYKVIGAGKTLGISKRRISFKFGFANRDALSDRLTGAACRGSEHEVVLVLSLASGKRNVILDGREVHFSQGEKMNRTFDFPFTVRVPSTGSVHARLIADSNPGARPFDFFINGMSYFHFSKIYELGTPAMRVGQLTEQRGSYGGSYTTNSEVDAPPEERRLIAQAKLESMRELREQQEREAQKAAESKQMNREEGNLINFDDDDIGQAPPPDVPQQGGMMYAASSITLDPALNQSYSYTQDAPAAAPTGAPYQNYSINTSQMNAPQQQYGYGAPAPSASTQYSEQSYSQQPGGPTSSMLTQYSQPPASYAPSPYAQTTASYSSASQQQPYSSASQQQYGDYPQQNLQSAPAPTYEETQMAFGSPAPAQQQFMSPQSYASYGSAPAFAQPPSASGSSAQQQQPPNGNYYGGYPSQGSGGW